MARRKYIKDYRLIERMDERGRIRTEYEYIGKAYRYAAGPEAVRREKRFVIALCAVGWLAFAGGLLPNAASMRAVFAAAPYLFTALPLGFLTDTALSSMPGEEPLRRQQAEALENRYPAASLWTAVLPGLALAGALVRLLTGGELRGGDAVFFLCAAALTAVGLLAFSRRGRFACREDG